jgi:hypothetical protein
MNWRLPVFGLMLAIGPASAQSALPGAAPPVPANAPAATPKSKKPSRASESRKGRQRQTLDRARRRNDRPASADAERQGGAAPAVRLRQDARGRQAAVARRERLRSLATLHRRHRRRKADRGDERGSSRRARPLRRRRAGLPFTFDVVDGAVLVPSQITACVFKAADCQTSPAGLWGPDGAQLEKDAAAIGKQRNEAEKAMARVVHAIDERAKENPDAATLHDQSAFAGQRDDACRDSSTNPRTAFAPQA